MRGDTSRHRCRTALLLATIFVAALPALADEVAADDESATPLGTGFQLAKEDDSFNTGLEDFQRYRDKKQWDAAFRALTTLTETPRKGFAQTGDFFVPSVERVRETIATLPPEGREAYRLFHDAKARQLFEQATQTRAPAASVAGAWDDVAPLKKIVDELFLTSFGDRAADRLGDAFFEAGSFAAAAEQWQKVLTEFPDSQIAPLRLHVKRATALARAGRSDALAEVVRTIDERFAGQPIDIAGRAQDAAAFVRSLPVSSVTVVTTQPSTRTALLPTSEKELWQTVFLDDAASEASRSRLASMGWGGMVDSLGSAIPPAVADDKRVYVNWIGITFAIDIATGKLAWWSQPFSQITKTAQLITEQGMDNDRFALSLVGGRLYAVGTLPVRNGGASGSHLNCYDPETGKQKWSTLNTAADYAIASAPERVGDLLVATGAKPGQANLELLAFDPETGKKRWNIPLGTGTVGRSFRGQGQVPPSVLRHHAGVLYVLTNNGALLAVNVERKQIDWALRTDVQLAAEGEQMFFRRNMGPAPIEPPGQLTIEGGVLYVKEQKSSKLYAIELATRKLLWKRPLASDETASALHEGRLITTGNDIGSIDPESRKLQWSTRLPVQTGVMRPLFGEGQMLVFVARGLYLISTQNGDVIKIVRGADSGAIGGTAWIVGDKLITVSNRAVTAYALPPATPAAQKPAAEGQP